MKGEEVRAEREQRWGIFQENEREIYTLVGGPFQRYFHNESDDKSLPLPLLGLYCRLHYNHRPERIIEGRFSKRKL